MGDGMLGRVVNALGEPIDDKGKLRPTDTVGGKACSKRHLT